MSTITKERVVNLFQFNSEGSDCQANAEQWEVHELARIALASLEAEPAIHRWRRVTPEPYGPYPWHYGDFIGFSNHVEGLEDEYFYSTPSAPAPVSDEDKVLAEQARAVIHCLDMCGVPSGDYADNEQLQLWGRVIEYGRHPASVSVPDGYRLQPISEYDAMCAAMLQGAEPAQGWIPCSDRMPTRNDRVLIFINFNSATVPPSIHDAQFTGSTFRRGNATVNVFPLEDGYGVTHWMPLPAAPQQED
ncbi:DUF551 domain-containing protein [Cronobacter sakazakii]|uniref:DUF551 domain-containing protein n=1 Tax=Cronobacter sakazakii TaxID=28141 RepID=UPI002108EA3A|nr:DUF551 domain-containing protein [Cronobacter sakazakii]